MKQLTLLSTALILITVSAEPAQNGASIVDVKSNDGTILKGTYFPAAKPGPGVLLFHQSNRARKSWEDIARQLAAVGINALTVDNRSENQEAVVARRS